MLGKLYNAVNNAIYSPLPAFNKDYSGNLDCFNNECAQIKKSNADTRQIIGAGAVVAGFLLYETSALSTIYSLLSTTAVIGASAPVAAALIVVGGIAAACIQYNNNHQETRHNPIITAV
jgi:hypothetical protein